MNAKDRWRRIVGNDDLSLRDELELFKEAEKNQVFRKKELYGAYLFTKHWRRFRWRILERDGYKCTNCGTDKSLQVHHKVYRGLGLEELEDCVALCKECHWAQGNVRLLEAKSKVKLSKQLFAVKSAYE